MIIAKAESNNFGPFKGYQSIELGEGIYSVICEYDEDSSRSNRGGKTMLVELFLYVLYGIVRSKSKKNMIYRDADSMMGKLTMLEDSGEVFEIERSCDKKGEKLLLTGTDGSNKDVVQNLIEQKIGLSKEDFLLSFYFKQMDISSFFDTGTTERKKVLARWFEKEYWATYFEKVDSDRKEVKEAIDKKTARIESLTDDFSLNDTTNELANQKTLCNTKQASCEVTKIELNKLNQQLMEKSDSAIYDNEVLHLTDKLNNNAIELESQNNDLANVATLISKNESDKSAMDGINARAKCVEIELAELPDDIVAKFEKSRLAYVNVEATLKAKDYVSLIAECKSGLAQRTQLVLDKEDCDINIKAIGDVESMLGGYNEDCAKLSSQLVNKTDLLNKINKYGGVCPVTEAPCPQASDIETQRVALEVEITTLKNSVNDLVTPIATCNEMVIKKKSYSDKLQQTIALLSVNMYTLEELSSLEKEYDSHSKQLKFYESSSLIFKPNKERHVVLSTELVQLNAQQATAIDWDAELKQLVDKQIKHVARIEVLNNDMPVVVERLKELNGIILNIKESAEVVVIKNSISECEAEHKSFESEVTQCIQETARLNTLLELHGKKNSEIKRLNSGIVEANKKYEQLVFVSYMFSGKGIPSIQIENSLIEIESETNVILGKLGTSLQMEFQSERELKSWEDACLACGTLFQKGERSHVCKACDVPRSRRKKDDLDVYVLENGVKQLYELDSGGGKTLICFAFKSAIARMLQKTLNVSFNSIILDEILAPLDEANTREIVDVILNALTKQFGFQQIFMISHKSEVKTSMHKTIRINRYSAEDYSEYELL